MVDTKEMFRRRVMVVGRRKERVGLEVSGGSHTACTNK